MIRANEIRVGNIFIGYDDKPFIWGLKEFSFIEPDVNISIDEIIKSPVVLNEEILLKLGMTKNHFRPERFDFEGVDNGQFHIDQLNGRFVFRGLGMTIVYVDYLHDLQNLHFACKRTELNTSGL